MIFAMSVLTPSARAICSLFPVARIALPISVPKNQYIAATIITTITIPTTSDAAVTEKPVRSEIEVIIVFMFTFRFKAPE